MLDCAVSHGEDISATINRELAANSPVRLAVSFAFDGKSDQKLIRLDELQRARQAGSCRFWDHVVQAVARRSRVDPERATNSIDCGIQRPRFDPAAVNPSLAGINARVFDLM